MSSAFRGRLAGTRQMPDPRGIFRDWWQNWPAAVRGDGGLDAPRVQVVAGLTGVPARLGPFAQRLATA